MSDIEGYHVGDHQHRDIGGGQARAAVFGANDGLVSNISLILGFAGADADPSVVRLAGLAGLIAGAVSMGVGEYISMQAQNELLERELDRERRALRRNPTAEASELARIYRSRGVDAEQARALAESLAQDPDMALEVHAREEIGIAPEALGNPLGAAAYSFLAFAVGAVVPLLPWFLGGGAAATWTSVVLSLVAAATLGFVLSVFTARSRTRGVIRQVSLAAGAAAITYAVGAAVGVNVG